MKKIIYFIKKHYKFAFFVLLTGILIGWMIKPSSLSTKVADQKENLHEVHEHSGLWTCSMHPQIKQEKPGDCPICAMELIPLKKSTGENGYANPNEIVLSEAATQLANIQTSLVKKDLPVKTIRMQGFIQPDERSIVSISARIGGRIDKLYINYIGQEVLKGQKLASIYSPELYSAHQELIEAIKMKADNPSFYQAAITKLKLLELNEKQIQELEKKTSPEKNYDVYAPASGTLTMRHVAEGDYIKTGMKLFEFIDLSRLWIVFDAYEKDLHWIQKNDEISFSVDAIPGKSFSSKIVFIDPIIDNKTRTAKLRADFKNQYQLLKPNMFVSGKLKASVSKNTVLTIPKTAVLWTGKRSLVYVKQSNRVKPSFLMREIILGPSTEDLYIVLEGLEENEEVVTNGAFKIDASAQLLGIQSMMNPKEQMPRAGLELGKTEPKETRILDQPETFLLQLEKFFAAYLKLNEAFVASDAKAVKNQVKLLHTALRSIDSKLFKDETLKFWTEQYSDLEKHLSKIKKTKDLNKQRHAFSLFNQNMYEVFKSFQLSNTEIYHQYCPMANDDKGAYWLSNKKEIRNPYFGDEMLMCGEVVEDLSKK